MKAFKKTQINVKKREYNSKTNEIFNSLLNLTVNDQNIKK